jgi:drug/metabolite transporter (DMT)-like permease
VTPDLTDLSEQIIRQSTQWVGIPIALIGAVFLSFGAQFQHRGVAKMESKQGETLGGLTGSQIFGLLRRPSWVAGTLMLGLAIVLQLTSLGFAPLIVVQPLGAIALVITAILNARVTHTRLNRRTVRAIGLCVGGVALFVTIAALTAVEQPITEQHLITILIILAVVLVAFGVAFGFFRKKFRAIFYIVGAGVLYGFVATLAKVVINRVIQGEFEGLTFVCLAGLLIAAGLGAYFVQTAYSSGPPDLVIAGLTVVDPLVAVSIGIVVLGEASAAPWWAIPAFIVAGVIAVMGVFDLAKNHPQIKR